MKTKKEKKSKAYIILKQKSNVPFDPRIVHGLILFEICFFISNLKTNYEIVIIHNACIIRGSKGTFDFCFKGTFILIFVV